jgi:hypothetical protein
VNLEEYEVINPHDASTEWAQWLILKGRVYGLSSLAPKNISRTSRQSSRVDSFEAVSRRSDGPASNNTTLVGIPFLRSDRATPDALQSWQI